MTATQGTERDRLVRELNAVPEEQSWRKLRLATQIDTAERLYRAEDRLAAARQALEDLRAKVLDAIANQCPDATYRGLEKLRTEAHAEYLAAVSAEAQAWAGYATERRRGGSVAGRMEFRTRLASGVDIVIDGRPHTAGEACLRCQQPVTDGVEVNAHYPDGRHGMFYAHNDCAFSYYGYRGGK